MSDMNCNKIKFVHKPSETDIENGVPKHSIESKLRLCFDSRKVDCLYYEKMEVDSEHFKANLNLCFYAFRKE
jgi:hypothetical protein